MSDLADKRKLFLDRVERETKPEESDKKVEPMKPKKSGFLQASTEPAKRAVTRKAPSKGG